MEESLGLQDFQGRNREIVEHTGANQNSWSHLVNRSHRPSCGVGQSGSWLGGAGGGQLSPEPQCLLRAPVREESLGLWHMTGDTNPPARSCPPAPHCRSPEHRALHKCCGGTGWGLRVSLTLGRMTQRLVQALLLCMSSPPTVAPHHKLCLPAPLCPSELDLTQLHHRASVFLHLSPHIL